MYKGGILEDYYDNPVIYDLLAGHRSCAALLTVY
jgi:hypothetical protein